MKKIMAAFITLTMSFPLTACGNNTQSSASESPSASQGNIPLKASSQETSSSQNAESAVTDTLASVSSSLVPEDSGIETTEAATGKTLVAYFSHSGNTRSVATNIQTSVGADIFEIKTTNEYPDSYDDVLEVAQKEKSDNALPELNATIDKIESYDTIFIGYPNWWGDMPMAIYTFLDTYDLSGKTVIPFCTNGGSGLSDTVNSIKTAEANATVLDGLAIRDSSATNSESAIAEWIAGLGL